VPFIRFLRILAMLLLVTPGVAMADKGLIGVWDAVVAGEPYVLILDANGTGRLLDQPIRWDTADDVFQVIVDGNSMAWRFVLSGDQLVFSDGGTAPITFTRRTGDAHAGTDAGGAATGSTPSGAAALAGKWQNPNGSIFELRADGTGRNAQGDFHWQAADGYFFLVETNLLLRYELKGSQLTVAGQDGVMTFQRADADARVHAAPADKSATAGAKTGAIVVNGTTLTAAEIADYEKQFRITMLAGRYWYDPKCGAWGAEGGPTVGFLPANLKLGGPLEPDASGTTPTGVFINGRQIHPVDVAALQQVTPVVPGRYWVDAAGWCGYEGNPTPLVNLVQLAQAARSRQGGTYHSRSDITGIGSGGDGKTSYVMGKDWSVIIGE
jgi:hypothetical protein